jgi:DNA polymerase-3 subunit gamma/tau
MRDALSLMDQAIAFSAGKVEEAIVHTMLGAIDQGYLFELLVALRDRDGIALIGIADNMAARSVAFDAALQELATLLHRVALIQTVPRAIADDEPERVRLLEMAQAFTPEEVQLFYQIAIHGRDEIELAPDEYAGFTMTILRMLAFAPARNVIQAAAMAAPTMATMAATQPIEAAGKPVREAAMVVASATKTPGGQAGSESGGRPDWGVLLAQLNVQGMAQQLAKHCVLETFSDGQITLRLSPEQKQLNSKMAIEKLQAALGEYFAKPMKLNISLGKTEKATPAVVEQQGKQLKQQLANDSIAQDDFVRAAQAELDAKLIEESVKPLQ